jgi:glycosyltransferase involved in cell wall biosynthesis
MNSGGIERCVVEMNSYITKNGYKSFVLSNGGKLLYQITQGGGKSLQLNVATKNPIKNFLNIFKIKNLIKQYEIDVVDVMSRAPAWSVYFACKLAKCPLVTSVHGNFSTGGIFTGFFKKLYNSSVMRGDRIICVSEYIKSYALDKYKIFRKNYFENKVAVIHRGVDVKQFNPENISQERVVSIINKLRLPDDKQIILLPGRFADWKGQLYFLDIISKIKNKNFVCLMTGSGLGRDNYKNKIKKKIKKLGIENLVRIEDAINDMAALYLVSNIVVSASIKGEAFGMVSTEAQAMERMLIATALGGSLETIIADKTKQTGWLIDVNDTERFARTIDEVLAMPLDERAKIGANARKNIVDNYTIEKMCDSTLRVYKEVTNS